MRSLASLLCITYSLVLHGQITCSLIGSW